MTRKWIPVLIIIATLVLSACQAAMATPQAPMEVSSAPSTGITDSYDKSMAESTGAFGDGSSTETTDRLVIKNANLSMAVIDPASAMNSVAQLATDMGGFVVSSNLYKTTDSNGVETPQANISIRVPAEKLDEAMTKIKTLAPDPKNDILSENVSGQDVTKEYTDLNSRLV
ncbi:MAG: DUF4349 domain-containing protein, partial [Anaerolineae bacterium]|nr:DUF4349 domain-containing protein [Anaerolineae bacterium]